MNKRTKQLLIIVLCLSLSVIGIIFQFTEKTDKGTISDIIFSDRGSEEP